MANPLLIPRRTVLRGLGVAMALPLLEQMGWAETPKAATAGVGGKAPLRMVHITFPNGTIKENWRFSVQAGAPMPRILEPLKPHMKDVLVLHGLNHQAASGGPDGAGDHARGTACLLTGVRVKKGGVAGTYTGISIDQLAAQKVGQYTTLPSLELGLEGAHGGGVCDDGYACSYMSSVSWRSPTQPMAKEVAPRSAFMRLFADRGAAASDQAKAAQTAENRSLLDLVNEDAKGLRGGLGGNDQRKLDEYLESVRAIEGRIQNISGRDAEDPAEKKPGRPTFPAGVPKTFAEHARLMYDLLVLAFQGDATRIATFMQGNAASGRSYPEIGIPNAHHELSHHAKDATKIDGITKINQHQVEQFAYFLGKLKETKDGKGSLLDNCLIFYGSGMADGDAHNHDDLPVVVAGGGGGTIRTGRVVQQCKGTLNDLHLGFLQRMGVSATTFGDNGRVSLPDLVG